MCELTHEEIFIDELAEAFRAWDAKKAEDLNCSKEKARIIKILKKISGPSLVECQPGHIQRLRAQCAGREK